MKPDAAVQSFLRDLQQKHKRSKKNKRKEGRSQPCKKQKKDCATAPNSQSQRHEILSSEAPAHPITTPPRQQRAAAVKFEHRYILAPMVGASELAFRLLCRRYGTQLAYTPMMSARQFAYQPTYREAEFQTCPADRPLVCHFAANNPADFAAAAVAAGPYCDAIDMNLGCPQRIAYLGHFGSYLLEEPDLICRMVRTAASAVPNKPIFCKIRLLDTLPDTVRLVQQLHNAGASLVTIHARYRASWERKGPGARDGPALLDQVAAIRKAVPGVLIVTNGNTVTWQDVVDNLEFTGAHGLMSAEGLLDNPALFLPRWGSNSSEARVVVPIGTPKVEKKQRKLLKKLCKIEQIEKKVQSSGIAALNQDEHDKLSSKPAVTKKLAKLQARSKLMTSPLDDESAKESVLFSDLNKTAQDKLNLVKEYLDLAEQYPVKMRSIIFHTRRMIKDVLIQYQLLEECLACQSMAQVRDIVRKIENYRANPASFVFDQAKAKQEKEALERKRAQEGKRKAYEARMIRKAKREGKADLMHYLHIGAEVPTTDTVQKLQKLPRDEAMKLWKEKHSQHCLVFHLDGNCTRGRACAFLHVDCSGTNSFVEQDEVAG